MKYIDAEKLKAEIERRLKNIRVYINGAGMKYKGPKFYKARGKESAYDAILNIITSLQREIDEKYQTPDWLFEEIVRYQREDMDRDTTVGDVARHFYKLGISAKKEE